MLFYIPRKIICKHSLISIDFIESVYELFDCTSYFNKIYKVQYKRSYFLEQSNNVIQIVYSKILYRVLPSVTYICFYIKCFVLKRGSFDERNQKRKQTSSAIVQWCLNKLEKNSYAENLWSILNFRNPQTCQA